MVKDSDQYANLVDEPVYAVMLEDARKELRSRMAAAR